VCLTINAQAQFKDFATCSEDERLLKTCPFDSSANAVILLNEASIYYNYSLRQIMDRRIKIKILNEKGYQHANISIPVLTKDGFEFLEELEGVTINFDNGGTPLMTYVGQNSFFDQDASDGNQYKKIAFPNVKVGSIIDLKYRSVRKHWNYLPTWYFQKDLPVYKSKLSVDFPQTASFTYQVWNSPGFKTAIKNKSKSFVEFELKDIPAFVEEPFMDAPRNSIQRVKFQISAVATLSLAGVDKMGTWEKLSDQLWKSSAFGDQIGKNLKGTKDFIGETKRIPDELERFKRILEFFKTNINWNGEDKLLSEEGILAPWENKKGNSAELSLILTTLLKESGLKVEPMLVAERFHDRVDRSFPFLDQFNTVFVLVQIKGKKYILDPRSMSGNFELTPPSVLNTLGFVINKGGGRMEAIVADEKKFEDSCSLRIELKENASFSGKGHLRRSGYARTAMGKSKISGMDELKNRVKEQLAEITISNYSITGERDDRLSLDETFDFSFEANRSNNTLIVPLNLFPAISKNPFLLKERISPINFGFKQSYVYNTELKIPDTYSIESTPKDTVITRAGGAAIISREISVDQSHKIIRTKVKIEIVRSLFGANEYPELREFFQKMIDAIQEPMLVSKK